MNNIHFEVDIFESDSDEDIEDFENIVNRRPKILHRRPDHLNFWDDIDFVNRFRLSKHTVNFLVEQLEERIAYSTKRNAALSPLQQLLLTLRFYATGTFQRFVGDDNGVHQSTACNIIRRVTTAFCLLKNMYISLPQGEEIIIVQQGLLIVDGTHIRIQSPGSDQAEWFRNRKGYFSINTMVACDHLLRIRYIVARWPGSANDMIVFMNSTLKATFENENNNLQNSIILGDSGHLCRNILWSLWKIRKQFGIWKRRFPCLALGIRTKIGTTQDIIVATAILHNIARTRGEPDLEVNPELQAIIEDGTPDNVNNEEESGAYHRELVQSYFTRL